VAERERKCTRKTQSVNEPARERELDKQQQPTQPLGGKDSKGDGAETAGYHR